MKPTITFRLSPYQLARGLQIVRSLEPNFQLTSLSQLVKIIYTDYLAKMSLGHTDEIDPKIMKDIQNFIITPKKREVNLSSIVDAEERLATSSKPTLAMPLPDEKTESVVSTVNDFSPPPEWDGGYEE